MQELLGGDYGELDTRQRELGWPIAALALLALAVIVVAWFGYKWQVASAHEIGVGRIGFPVVQFRTVFSPVAGAMALSKLVDIVDITVQDKSALSLSNQRFLSNALESPLERKEQLVIGKQKGTFKALLRLVRVVWSDGWMLINGKVPSTNDYVRNSSWGSSKVSNLQWHPPVDSMDLVKVQSWRFVGQFDVRTLNNALVNYDGAIEERLGDKNQSLQRSDEGENTRKANHLLVHGNGLPIQSYRLSVQTQFFIALFLFLGGVVLTLGGVYQFYENRLFLSAALIACGFLCGISGLWYWWVVDLRFG